MAACFVLDLHTSADPLRLSLRNTNARATPTIAENSATFDLPAGQHTYLTSKDDNSFATLPISSALPLEPNQHYRIRGHADFAGLGRAQLYIIEYDDQQRVATHSEPLEAGPFQLTWQTAPETRSCCLAIRLSGSGQLSLADCTFEPTDGPWDPVAALASLADTGQTRIFIAGCPRSGTTLLLNMMRCFEDAHVDLVERTVKHFTLLDRPEHTIVLKRTGDCWKYIATVPPSIDILYLVRNPFDVLTSKHPLDPKEYFVDFDYWLNEFRAYQQLQSARENAGRLLILRYEDLVSQPARVQQLIQNTWNLTPAADNVGFDRVDTLAHDDQPSRFQAALGGVRPPDTASVEKWRHDPRKRQHIIELIRQHPRELAAFLDTFGYSQHDILAQALADPAHHS